MRGSALAFLTSVLALSFTAIGPTLADDPITLDVRQGADLREHQITILSEDAGASLSDFGHAFVIFSQEDDKRQMTTFNVVGFYPPDEKVDGTKSLWKVPIGKESLVGKFKNDFDEIDRAQHKVILKVDQAQYDRALNVVARWQETHPNYFAGVNDCTTFVGEIASAAGMDLPSRAVNLLPTNFVTALVGKAQETHLEDRRVKDRVFDERIKETNTRSYRPSGPVAPRRTGPGNSQPINPGGMAPPPGWTGTLGPVFR